MGLKARWYPHEHLLDKAGTPCKNTNKGGRGGRTMCQNFHTRKGKKMIMNMVCEEKDRQQKGRRVAISIPMYFFKPFIHTSHVIFMVAGKNSYFVTFLVLGQANVTPGPSESYYQAQSKRPQVNKVGYHSVNRNHLNICSHINMGAIQVTKHHQLQVPHH